MNASHNHVDDGSCRLNASGYDRASSGLLALLTVVGLAVLVLGTSWLNARMHGDRVIPPPPPKKSPTEHWAIYQGEGNPLTGKPRFDPVKNEQLQLSDAEDDLLKKTLENATKEAASQAAAFDLPPLSNEKGFGIGDGNDMDGFRTPSKTPPQELLRRWEVRFAKGMTLDEYARQLDFFHIELAVLLPNGRVAYASNLSKRRPDGRTGEAANESRYYLVWRSGELQQADRQLLGRAGIDVGDRPIVKFLPPPLEAQLVALEKAHAGEKFNRLRSTRFGIRAEGDGYAFHVVGQSYR
jgi:hypothetical protein